jgi:hypothetical protein
MVRQQFKCKRFEDDKGERVVIGTVNYKYARVIVVGDVSSSGCIKVMKIKSILLV